MASIPDDPLIQCAERTGLPPWNIPETWPVCPVCKRECEYIYRNKEFGIVGCDLCLPAVDAWEVNECFSDN